jgi:hypothetical protein
MASGIYDGVLGLAFLVFPVTIYRVAQVTPPNHWGYIRFLALLLLIFAGMFFAIAANPQKRREQMLYGMALKISYAATVFAYQLQPGGIPALWVPWAWADLVFLILFWWSWRSLAEAL